MSEAERQRRVADDAADPEASGVSPKGGHAADEGLEDPHRSALATGATQLSVAATTPPVSDVASALTAEPPLGPDDGGERLVGRVLAGRYRIERMLGAGGMGTVYRARHVHMRKTVAVKVLHREMTHLPEVVARFEREAVAAANIEHPNVAAATDFGRLENDSFYLVLEYIEGQSLTERLDREGVFPPPLALHIVRQIADALATAHAAGVVHRDLKPDNVMLVERDGDPGFVKVLDFGIAKVDMTGGDQQALTKLGSIFGTPDYMAPEQAAGRAVDGRADLYALGIMLYQMLVGRTPFQDDDMVVVLTRQLTAPPEPLPDDIDPALQAIVARLLAKSPDDRFQSPEELLVAIDQWFAEAGAIEADAVDRTAPGASTGVRQVATRIRSIAGGSLRWLTERVSAVVPLRKVQVAGRALPLRAVVATAAVLAIAAGVAALSLGDGSAATQPALITAIGEGLGLDAQHRERLRKAEAGDAKAIAELLERPDSSRSPEEWLALAKGHSKLGNFGPAVAAYGRALEANPSVAEQPEVLSHLRQAAVDPKSFESALTLAARLGFGGIDLIYDVAGDKSPAAKPSADLAEKLLADPAIANKASPALRLVLDLRGAKGCNAYKKLLPQAVEHADTRALSRLTRLRTRRGCGFLGLGDCYSCLRSGGLLEQAIAKAQGTKAPEFAAPPAKPQQTTKPAGPAAK